MAEERVYHIVILESGHHLQKSPLELGEVRLRGSMEQKRSDRMLQAAE
jgi:hypothetical protein